MDLATFAARLDDRLRTDAFAEIDSSANGLQVGSADATVESAAFAVDAAVETIERAAGAGADALVVHHGLLWGGIERLTGRTYDRIAALIEADMALYVSHLPLDAHPQLGNAAGLADLLGLTELEPFGTLGGEFVGRRGQAPEPYTPDELQSALAEELAVGDGIVHLLGFGPDHIEDVAVVTGAGADWLDEAVQAGCDALVTGEGKGRLYHEAQESGISVVLAGHYATETFGVRALCDLVAGWGIEATFVEAPTGL